MEKFIDDFDEMAADVEDGGEGLISSYEKVIGAQISTEGENRLRLIKESLNIRDNDALWSIIFALESYIGLYEKIPDRIKETSEKALEDIRESVSVLAKEESAKAQESLIESIVRTSEEIAGRRATAAKINSFALMMFVSVVFGSLCFVAGLSLGDSSPVWLLGASKKSTLGLISMILSAPAGWVLFLIAAAPAVLQIKDVIRQIKYPESRKEQLSGVLMLMGIVVVFGLAAWIIYRVI